MRVSDISRTLAFRVVFLGTLVVSLAYGLNWATEPELLGDPLPRYVREGETRALVPTAPTPMALSPTTPSAPGTPGDGAAASLLMAAARPPRETTVAVLDAGAGPSGTQAAADRLARLGYEVVGVGMAPAAVATTVTATAVWYGDGNQTEAHALRARERRVGHVRADDTLAGDADLHVLVAEDWS